MTNKSEARVDFESINDEMPESVKESHVSSWQGEEILQTHDKRFICDIIQSICPTTPRILCSGMEPVHGERHRQFRENATETMTHETTFVILAEAKRRPNRNFQNIKRTGKRRT